MLDKLIRFSYPFPIAATYQNIQSIVYPEEMPHKYNRIIDLYDSILKIITYYLIGQAFHERIIDSEIRRQLEITLKNPIPFNWTKLMSLLLDKMSKSNEPLVKEISKFYNGTEKKLHRVRTAIYYMQDKASQAYEYNDIKISSFFQNYNYFISETDMVGFDYAEAIDILIPAFEEILMCMEFLKDYALAYVSNIQIEGNRFDHNIDIMSGIVPARKRYISDEIIKQRNRKMYLFRTTSDGLEPMFCLHPFIVEHRCGIHNKEEIYFLRYKLGEDMDYYCFQCRERFRPERISLDYNEILDNSISESNQEITDEVIDLYRKLLLLAWEDGVLSKDDRAKLEYIRSHFHINESMARGIEENIKYQKGLVGIELELKVIRNYEDFFKNSIIKGAIIPPMRKFIDNYREKLGIPSNYAQKLESRIWYDEGLKHEKSGNPQLAGNCYFNAQSLDENNLAAYEKVSEFSILERSMGVEIKVPERKTEYSKNLIRSARANTIYPEEEFIVDAVNDFEESDGYDTVVLKVQNEKKIKEPLVKVTDINLSEENIYLKKSSSKSKLLKATKIDTYEDENYEIYDTSVDEISIIKDEHEDEKVLVTIDGKVDLKEETQKVEPEEPESSQLTISDEDSQKDTQIELMNSNLITNKTTSDKVSKEEDEDDDNFIDEDIPQELMQDVSPEEIKELIGEDYDLYEDKQNALFENDDSTQIKEPTSEVTEDSEKDNSLLDKDLKDSPCQDNKKNSIDKGQKDLEDDFDIDVPDFICEKETNNLDKVTKIPEEIVTPSLENAIRREGEIPRAVDTAPLPDITSIIRQATKPIKGIKNGKESQKIVKQLNKAKNYLQEENYKAAKVELDQIIEVEPKNPAARLLRGRCAIEDEDFDLAFEDLSEVIKSRGDDSILLLLRGKAALEIGELDIALDDLNKVIEERPSNIDGYFIRGSILLDLGEFEKAVNDFDRVIIENPNKVDSFINRGSCYLELKEYEQSLDDFKKAEKIEPNDSYPYFKQGLLYSKLNNPDKALELFNKAIELEPDEIEYHIQKSEVLAKVGRIEEALEELEMVLLDENDIPLIYLLQGKFYEQIGNNEKALESYNFLKKIDGELAEGLSQTGRVFASMGKFEESLKNFDKAIEEDPYHVNTYLFKGDALLEMKMFDEAIESFSEALKLDNTISQAYLHRGIAYEKMGNSEKAQEDFSNYLKINRLDK